MCGNRVGDLEKGELSLELRFLGWDYYFILDFLFLKWDRRGIC